MTFYENMLTGAILLAMAILGYLKVTNKTLVEFIRELRDIFSPPEVLEGGLPTQ